MSYVLDDGFGNVWHTCDHPAGCELQIVRPGKVQCTASACPNKAFAVQYDDDGTPIVFLN